MDSWIVCIYVFVYIPVSHVPPSISQCVPIITPRIKKKIWFQFSSKGRFFLALWHKTVTNETSENTSEAARESIQLIVLIFRYEYAYSVRRRKTADHPCIAYDSSITVVYEFFFFIIIVYLRHTTSACLRRVYHIEVHWTTGKLACAVNPVKIYDQMQY